MKVYVLVNSKNEIDGVFTYEGKLAKKKELLEEARRRRTGLIDLLLEDSTNVSVVVDRYNSEISDAFIDVSSSPSNLLNIIALRDHAVAKLRAIRERISALNDMSDEELVAELNKTHWEVRELLGD
jgi:hypothetical protein